jgi:hypothetical protein
MAAFSLNWPDFDGVSTEPGEVHVTASCCDVTGSTALGGELDPEVLPGGDEP